MNTDIKSVAIKPYKTLLIAICLFIIMFGTYVFLGSSNEQISMQTTHYGKYALKALIYTSIITVIILLQNRFIAKKQPATEGPRGAYKVALLVLAVMTILSSVWLAWYFFFSGAAL